MAMPGVVDRLLGGGQQARLERRIAHYNDPSSDGLRTRAGRRRVVFEGLGLALLATALTVAFTALLQGYLNLVLSLPTTVGIWYLWVDRLRVTTRGLTELPPSVLDERQRIARALAFERSYRLVIVGFLIVPFLAFVDRFVGLDPGVLFVVGLIGILLAIATPPLVLALAEPGETAVTENDGVGGAG
jgi:hypothetical protein